MFTSNTAFSRRMLLHTDFQLSIGVVSFESAAEIYNNMWSNPHPLHKRRLEDAWFVFKIMKYVRQFNPWPRNAQKELDIESLCEQVYAYIRNVIDQKWISHVCSEVGCKERFIVIDGNEKLYRSICNAERSKIIGVQGNVNKYDLCIRNPIRGNQHISSSKFCIQHAEGKTGEGKQNIDLRPITRSFKKDIPPTITSERGCKNEDKVDKFYPRTAGMFYMFRSCGVRLSHWEMYTAESLSNVFLWMIDLFGEKPLPELLKEVVYDRACDLCPFVNRLANEGSVIAGNYKDLSYIVDIFHAEKHTMPKCELTSPNCEYHPHLEKFSYVKKMNTEIAEQSFNKLNPFKYITRKMTYARRLLYFKFLDDFHNSKITKIDAINQ